MIGSAEVRQVAEECTAFLTSALDADWATALPDLDFSVVEVVAHVAEACLWYAVDLSAGGEDLGAIELRVKPDVAPRDVVATLAAHSRLLAAVIELAPASARGFHPFGIADPSGFAAMACDEMLIHTRDVATGLDLPFAPAAGLVEPTLRRLFPWVELDTDPWDLLQWANGRVALTERPRLNRWRWHCAPRDEWDGTEPTA